jgi:hypothetical protein
LASSGNQQYRWRSFGPRARDARRAETLSFAADADIDEAVQAFIEDDLELQRALG